MIFSLIGRGVIFLGDGGSCVDKLSRRGFELPCLLNTPILGCGV